MEEFTCKDTKTKTIYGAFETPCTQYNYSISSPPNKLTKLYICCVLCVGCGGVGIPSTKANHCFMLPPPFYSAKFALYGSLCSS